MASVTLSPELSQRIEKTAQSLGTDAESLICELLGPPFEQDEVTAIKEALKPEKCRSADEFFAEHRKRYPESPR